MKNKKGFTLVELLVVIAIIGIVVAVATPALFKNINKAKVAELISDYNTIKGGVLEYYSDKSDSTAGINAHGALRDQKEIQEYFENKVDSTPFGGWYRFRNQDGLIEVIFDPLNPPDEVVSGSVDKYWEEVNKAKRAMKTILSMKSYIEKESNGDITVDNVGNFVMHITK